MLQGALIAELKEGRVPPVGEAGEEVGALLDGGRGRGSSRSRGVGLDEKSTLFFEGRKGGALRGVVSHKGEEGEEKGESEEEAAQGLGNGLALQGESKAAFKTQTDGDALEGEEGNDGGGERKAVAIEEEELSAGNEPEEELEEGEDELRRGGEGEVEGNVKGGRELEDGGDEN